MNGSIDFIDIIYNLYAQLITNHEQSHSHLLSNHNSDDLSSSIRIQGNSWIIFLLIMAAIFWLYRLVKVIFNVLSYWEIRQFYIKALKIQMVRDAFMIDTFIKQQDFRLKCKCNMLCLVLHNSFYICYHFSGPMA